VKVRVLGESETVGTAAVPLKLTVWGLPLALSAMLKVAASADTAVAEVNVTLTVHVPPAPRLVPQVLVWAKSLFEVVNSEKVSVAFPELVTVTDCAALVTPTAVVKVRLVAERATPGPVPVPLRATC
jgi:hypothetical protein